MKREHDDDAEPDDRELPDPSDMDDEEGDEYAETEPCPHCGAAVYEGAEICPKCGQYISEETTVHRQPLWIVIGVIVCLLMFLLAYFR